MTDLGRTARLDVLVKGYARLPNVAGTVSLVRDAGRVVVVEDVHLEEAVELAVAPRLEPELDLQAQPQPLDPRHDRLARERADAQQPQRLAAERLVPAAAGGQPRVELAPPLDEPTATVAAAQERVVRRHLVLLQRLDQPPQAVGAAVKGYDDAGVVSTVKHFPGHGGATSDSHDVLPELDSTLEELRAHDLPPFDAAVRNAPPRSAAARRRPSISRMRRASPRRSTSSPAKPTDR